MKQKKYQQKKAVETVATEIIAKHIQRLLRGHDVGKISVPKVADLACREIDPDHRSPSLMQGLAVLQLRQITRGQLQMRLDPAVRATDNPSLFIADELQAFYPVERSGEACYIRRDYMTVAERRETAQRLRKVSESLKRHAATLDAETDQLIREGKLKEDAA